MIATLRTADTDDITAATALLYRALLASPTGRLPGSATTGRAATFADLLTASLYFGRVDLAVTGERIDGVACWLDHPHGPVPLLRKSGARASMTCSTACTSLIWSCPWPPVTRISIWPASAPGPATTPAPSPTCSCTANASSTTTTATPLYAEVHDQPLRSWLLRSGYHDHGISLGTETHPESFLLSFTGIPP